MILYTNGDSHTAAAEAVNLYSFADDDRIHWAQKRRPHPDNLKVSWGVVLSSLMKTSFFTDAESESDNKRIIHTVKEWIARTKDNVEASEVLMIIQWSSWDNEDWTFNTHQNIRAFHAYLDDLGYRHFFFNGNKSFVEVDKSNRIDWGESFLDPYLPEGSFDGFLQANGHDTVITSNKHYGRNAHAAWANHLLQHIIKHEMI